MFNIRKKLAVILVAAIVVGQCGVSVFADEQLAKAVSKNAKLITVTTESDAEYDAASDSATDANAATDANDVTDEDYTSSSNAKYINASSSDAKYANASSSDADYEDDIDFVPEQLLVSVRGGLDGLYFTVDENQDTTFLDDFTFESLAVIDDKYDRGNDIVEAVGEPEEDAPDEVDFTDDSDEEKDADITEYQVFKVTTPGYKTKAQLNALASKIEKLPAVQYAELNKVIRLDSINSDDGTLKGVNRQWAYNYQQGKYSMGVTDPDYSGADKIINWDEYKDPTVASPSAAPKIKTTTNAPVVVVMDSGIDYTHEDLDDVMWIDTIGLGGGTYGYDAIVTDPSGKEPMDNYGHGTHCAGIIAAEWNGIGVSGITSGVELMAIKILDDSGLLMMSSAYKAYEYLNKAQDNGVNVVAINCSWGGIFAGDMVNQFVSRAGEKGAVSCFASANDSLDLDKKMNSSAGMSNNPYAVIVNACDDDGNLACFSNYGLKSTDVAAPGLSIYSTINGASAKPDYCSSYAKPVEDDNGIKAINDSFGSNEYFECKSVDSLSVVTPLSKGGLNDSDCLKVTAKYSDSPMCIRVKIPDNKFTTNAPTSFGFAIRCPKQSWSKALRVYAYLKDPTDPSSTDNQCYCSNGYWASNSWESVVIPVKTDTADLMAKKEIFLVVYCQDSKDNPVYSGYDVYIDRMMLINNGAIAYGMMSGTSMAAPAVTGEAAVLSEYFYENSLKDKSERAKNIAARIKGSTQKNDTMKGKMQSGGMVRIDYAVHGKTDPVINDLTICKINGKYKAELSGYFFDGNAVDGENDESFVSLSIDGKTFRASDIISQNGETITFNIPRDCVTGEHFFEVTSTKGTGSAYIDCHASDMAAKDRFIRIQIPESNSEMMKGMPLSIKAIDGKMFMLVGKADAMNITLWVQDIDEAISGTGSAGEWKQVKNFAGQDKDGFDWVADSINMTVLDNKIIGIGRRVGDGESDDVCYVWEYDLTTGNVTKSELELPSGHNEIIICPGMFYLNGRLLFTYGVTVPTNSSKNEYETFYCELERDSSGKYSLKSRMASEKGKQVKSLAEIIYDGSNYYVVCGNMLGGNGSYSIERLTMDNSGVTEITTVNSNVLDGIESLLNDDYAIVKSASYINGKTIFTGPAIAYDNYIEADTYVISDVSKSAVPVNKFVSTTALANVCSTVDSYGNYYVMANTNSEEHNWIYAYTDTNELGRYVHKDRVIWSYDIEGSSGGNGSNTATPYYPSYVEKGGKWVKVTGADGRITWRFTDSKGQLCVNKWVAIPDEDGLTGGSFGWYRFDPDGNMITGWYTDDKGRRFYLDPTEGNLKGKMKTGWILIDGKWYYFKETGKDDFGVLVPDKVKS